ncbi:unknown protein [Waddlia chondrophila 2032/99]|uniref:Uncharacterized protein n=1 Tax=Waddlia chondrophila 2032/99 TaxID=765953 RepID=F8LE81_9BACT|nr:unknown protein [Waddlia chondrophila 2032/99]
MFLVVIRACLQNLKIIFYNMRTFQKNHLWVKTVFFFVKRHFLVMPESTA